MESEGASERLGADIKMLCGLISASPWSMELVAYADHLGVLHAHAMECPLNPATQRDVTLRPHEITTSQLCSSCNWRGAELYHLPGASRGDFYPLGSVLDPVERIELGTRNPPTSLVQLVELHHAAEALGAHPLGQTSRLRSLRLVAEKVVDESITGELAQLHDEEMRREMAQLPPVERPPSGALGHASLQQSPDPAQELRTGCALVGTSDGDRDLVRDSVGLLSALRLCRSSRSSGHGIRVVSPTLHAWLAARLDGMGRMLVELGPVLAEAPPEAILETASTLYSPRGAYDSIEKALAAAHAL